MSLCVGQIIEGKISGITNFGAFLSFDDKTGLVHISEVSSQYVKDLKEHLKIGDVVKAKITSMDNGKISLSIKQAMAPTTTDKKPYEKKPYGDRNSYNGRPSRSNNSSPKPQLPTEMSFDDMLNKFKVDSEEKMASIKHSFESKRGSSYKRQ